MDLVKEFGIKGIEILEEYCKSPRQIRKVLKGKLSNLEIDNLVAHIGELREVSTKSDTTKRQYRIEHWRSGEHAETIEIPAFEGKTEEECDDKAITRMRELSSWDRYSWDNLRVSRIDVLGVIEKKTFLQGVDR